MFKTLVYNGQSYSNFEINELGDVRNISTNHIYKKSISKQGYYFVSLPMGERGKVKYIRVHKAVAETFLPNPDNLPYVDHIDENKLNCCLDNLQWISAKDNTNKHWQHISQLDSYCNNRKLTKSDVNIIRANKNISNKQLAILKITILILNKSLTTLGHGEKVNTAHFDCVI